MNLLRKVRNFVGNLRREGFSETIRMYRYRIRETYGDWRLGIRTKGLIEAHELGHHGECQPYEAINYRCLHQLFQLAPPEENGVFLDYGCGLGRAVVVAATHSFRRVIGIELSADLSEQARDNVAAARHKLGSTEVQIVTTDAAEYVVPDGVTMILLFNPFTGGVLSAVQEQIRESLLRSPRQLWLAYMHPQHQSDTFERCRWLRRVRDLPTEDWNEVNFVLYQSLEDLPSEVGISDQGRVNATVDFD